MPGLIKIKALRPKIPPLAAEFFRHHFARYTLGLWLWGFAAGFLTLASALLLCKIFFAGAHLRGQALQNGQRVFIEIASGEIEGNARHTRPASPKPEAASTPGITPAAGKDGLAPAPLESISQQTEKGIVPIVGRDGTLPWKYYARAAYPQEKHPLVAVVITALALSKPLTEDALKLPHDFTLSFSPYAGDAPKWAGVAREAGFETLVDLPMQSQDFVKTGNDPGRYGLLEEAGAQQNSERMQWVLSRFPGYVGTLAPENESLTSNLTAIRQPLIELAAHGVLFLYIKTPKNAPLGDVVKARRFYALGIDKVLDDDIARGPIDRQLDDLTSLAKSQGYAIGFAHAYPPTLQALGSWADGLSGQGVDLVPVSAIGMKLLP